MTKQSFSQKRGELADTKGESLQPCMGRVAACSVAHMPTNHIHDVANSEGCCCMELVGPRPTSNVAQPTFKNTNVSQAHSE